MGFMGHKRRRRQVTERHLGKSIYQRKSHESLHGLGAIYKVLCDCCGAVMTLSYVAFRQRIEKPFIKERLLSPLMINVQQVGKDRPTYSGLGFNSS
jgi:hypothetical protein